MQPQVQEAAVVLIRILISKGNFFDVSTYVECVSCEIQLELFLDVLCY